MARPKGFEPLASASGGQRSIQLSYGRKKLSVSIRPPLFQQSRGLAGGALAALAASPVHCSGQDLKRAHSNVRQ
jgi:hypothetical protein